MTEVGKRVPFRGVPLYCSDCRRVLVSFNGDGTIFVSKSTDVRGSLEGEINDDGTFSVPREAVVTGAICLRARCRLRRWLRGRKKVTTKGRER